jgi:DNA repair exonuclease SbcCD ATPase subunit
MTERIDNLEGDVANIKGYISHNKPSKETMKSLNKFEKKMEELQKEVGKIGQKVVAIETNFENQKERNIYEHEELKGLVGSIGAKIDDFIEKIDKKDKKIRKEIDDKYVLKTEFNTVKLVVFGCVGTILLWALKDVILGNINFT